MFFRRMFARKDINDADADGNIDVLEDDNNNNHNKNYEMPQHFRKHSSATVNKHYNSTSTSGSAVVQLTPLWEHILRTRTLPAGICPVAMFAEFYERLRDPEWQVRQHALRVLVDVLVVMRARADAYMDPLIAQLVENLGHQAPTVRKGALDCLRVYLAETAMAETILLQILDIGLNQKITNEPFGGRLTCGVMLSLPALVQSALHTPKRHFILRTTIDMLVQKMGQVTHQEITLKVLTKIRELIGSQEFVEFMSHDAYREFELLCNVYGVGSKPTGGSGKDNFTDPGSWRATSQQTGQSCWRSSEEEEELMMKCASQAKVILEKEIKINDETLTMRILEAKDSDCVIDTETEESPRKSSDTTPNSFDEDVVCGRLLSAKSLRDAGGIVQLLSDSELEDISHEPQYYTVVTPSTPSRTPKRVTFGGEVVKMRTPDSDAASSNNKNNKNHDINKINQSAVDAGGGCSTAIDNGKNDTTAITIVSLTSPTSESATTALNLEIPNDNTKPLARPESTQSPKNDQNSTESTKTHDINSSLTDSHHSPIKRTNSNVSASLSPSRSPFKRISISPVDSIISPRAPHKQIEVLHNLQRDPSPVRGRSTRQTSLRAEAAEREVIVAKHVIETQAKKKNEEEVPKSPPPRSWEELGIVSSDTIMDLRSGDWRHRLQGIVQLEEALRDSDNLARIQPCLDILLRTLLSSERNHEVAEAKHRLIMNLILRLPLDNLEDRTGQIMTGLCRQGDAGANRVCKALMQRLPPASIVLKLISEEFLHAKSSRFREHALQMVMYALMTFPSTCFDTTTCVTNATYAALNRKRRVRQAALDVLAILGHITTPRAVMDVVQNIAEPRDDGDALIAAIKARLSRKQLPLVTSDGLVQYTSNTRVPTSKQNIDNDQQAADIEWITAGVGSVSPTSLKRRAHKIRCSSQQSFCCLPLHNQHGSNHSDDSSTQRYHTYHTFRSPPEVFGNVKDVGGHIFGNSDDNQSYNLQHVLGSSVPIHFGISSKKSNVDYANYSTRRMVAKSCSDSSMDGRSSDSTYTNSSSGGGGVGSGSGAAVAAVAASRTGGISGRFTRQTVNSRFPAMDRLDATYVRVHKPPTHYPGMGAYAHLQQQQYSINSTYPKINYTMPITQQRRRSQQHQHQHPPFYTNNYSNNQHYQQQQEQQQHRHQPQYQQHNNSTTQENFKSTENHFRAEQNNSNNSLDGTYNNVAANGSATAAKTNNQQQIANGGNNAPRRFVNVEKFIMQRCKKSIVDPAVSNSNTVAINSESNNKLKGSLIALSTPVLTLATQEENINKSSQTNGTSEETAVILTEPIYEPKQSPVSVSAKSTAYSQKSTAQWSSNDEINDNSRDGTTKTDTSMLMEQNPTGSLKQVEETSDSSPKKWTSAEEMLRIEDIVDAATEAAIVMAAEGVEGGIDSLQERNDSLISLQSKTDSIKTQMEDTPPALSRTQSNRSLVIDEDLDGNGTFVVVEELKKQPAEEENAEAIHSEVFAACSPSSKDNSPVKQLLSSDENNDGDEYDAINACSKPNTPKSRPQSRQSANRSPTIAELKTLSRRNSMIKSMESLYERPPSKQGSLDNTTETSSLSSSQLNTTIPFQTKHTPLKQKSKTSHFLKNNRRRVSPVKQSMKMTQTQLYPPTLQRFDKPREALIKTFDQLDSTNWEIIIVGLKSMVRLLRYHPENLENQMHMVCIQLTRAVRNLRSQVARAACQATMELFTLKTKVLEQECDDLVCALLHRSADTNRFLRADATLALESMCDNLSATKVLNVLTTKGALHQNAMVRTTAAKLLSRLVERLGCDKVFSMSREHRDKFFVTGANLLLEGSLETRSYAKSLFRLLSEHHNYNRLLLEIIPQRTYRNVEKTLKSIR